jgi:hypothetical protein
MTDAAARAHAVSAAAATQCGLLSREQLRDVGVGADAIRNHIAAGRWQLLGNRVVALHNGPLSPEQIEWYAVLDGGPDCVVSGLSALHKNGLTGFAVVRVETEVPRGQRTARNELFIRRSSRRLMPDAVHPVRRPPQLRLHAAIIDALETMTLPLRGCALLAALVQQRLVRASELRSVVQAAGTTRPERPARPSRPAPLSRR